MLTAMEIITKKTSLKDFFTSHLLHQPTKQQYKRTEGRCIVVQKSTTMQQQKNKTIMMSEKEIISCHSKKLK